MAILRSANLNQNQTSGQKIIWLLIAIAVLVVGYVLFQAYYKPKQDFNTITVYTPKSAVTKNRYFTAIELLGERGHVLRGNQDSKKVETLLDEDAELAKQHALMIYDFSSQKDSDHEKILAWVNRGGHLIIASQAVLEDASTSTSDDFLETYQEKQNPLLFTLGITYKKFNHNEQSVQLDKNHTLSKYITPLRLEDGQTLLISNASGVFDTSELLQKYPDVQLYDYAWFAKNENNWQYVLPIDTGMTNQESAKIQWAANHGYNFSPNKALVDMQFGQGRITVLGDKDMFVNPFFYPSWNDDSDASESPKPLSSRAWQILTATTSPKLHNYEGGILDADNAYFLKVLTDSREVYFLPDIESVSLLTLLWQFMRWTVIGLILTLILALLALPKRFGRYQSYQTDTSYNIFGFFSHVGQYLWASDGANGLLNTNRATLIRSVIAKEQMIDATPAKIIEILSIKTSLSTHLIQNALYDTWQNDEEFLYISRNFARLAQLYT